MRDVSKMLWCDLRTDAERIEFLKCGRAWNTGIIAHGMIPEIIELLEYRMKHQAPASKIKRFFSRSQT